MLAASEKAPAFSLMQRRNALAMFVGFSQTLGHAPHVRIDGEAEARAYALSFSREVSMQIGGAYVPLAWGRARPNARTVFAPRKGTDGFGWSALRLEMTSRLDLQTAIWRIASSWATHFVGLDLWRLEVPAETPVQAPTRAVEALLRASPELRPNEARIGVVCPALGQPVILEFAARY